MRLQNHPKTKKYMLIFHANMITEYMLAHFILSCSGQCISPGIVETEFAFRHHNSDPEKAASVYESIKVSQVCECV